VEEEGRSREVEKARKQGSKEARKKARIQHRGAEASGIAEKEFVALRAALIGTTRKARAKRHKFLLCDP